MKRLSVGEVDISGTSTEAFGSLIVICSPFFTYYAFVRLFTSNCHYLFILLVSSSLPPICPPSLYPLTFCSVLAMSPLLSLKCSLLVVFKSFFYLLFRGKKKTEKIGDECSEKIRVKEKSVQWREKETHVDTGEAFDCIPHTDHNIPTAIILTFKSNQAVCPYGTTVQIYFLI